MIFTSEERRALLVLGAVLAFGQALSWWEGWRDAHPSRELSLWLNQVAAIRDAGIDSLATADSSAEELPAGSAVPLEARPARLEAASPGMDVTSTSSGATADPVALLPGEIPVLSVDALPPGVLETGRLRLDLATAEELATLPGIGPALAGRILEERAHRPFHRPEDLLRVKGIGAKTFARIRDRISVAPPMWADSGLVGEDP